MYRSFSLLDLVSRVDIVEHAPATRPSRVGGFVASPQGHIEAFKLVSALKAADTEIAHVYAALRSALSLEADRLERFRYYLSRVPVPFTYTYIYYNSPTTGMKLERLGLAYADKKYEIDSEACPREYFDRLASTINQVHHGERVWGLYPPEAAERLSFGVVPTWSEKDSIIDWLSAFVKTEADKLPPLECRREGGDILYRFTYPAMESIEDAGVTQSISGVPKDSEVEDEPIVTETLQVVSGAEKLDESRRVVDTAQVPHREDTQEALPVSDVSEGVLDPFVVNTPEVPFTEEATDVDNVVEVSRSLVESVAPLSDTEPDPIPPEAALSAAEQIYRFIRENGDTPAGAVRAQQIVSERQTKRLLSELVNAGRLERPKHGVYRAIEMEREEDGKTD